VIYSSYSSFFLCRRQKRETNSNEPFNRNLRHPNNDLSPHPILQTLTCYTGESNESRYPSQFNYHKGKKVYRNLSESEKEQFAQVLKVQVSQLSDDTLPSKRYNLDEKVNFEVEEVVLFGDGRFFRVKEILTLFIAGKNISLFRGHPFGKIGFHPRLKKDIFEEVEVLSPWLQCDFVLGLPLVHHSCTTCYFQRVCQSHSTASGIPTCNEDCEVASYLLRHSQERSLILYMAPFVVS